MKSKLNQAGDVDSASALNNTAADNVVHMEPQVGGSFVRDLSTGELKQMAGPVVTEQPVQE
ncbi:hypothetical protein ASC94_09215 [Massilia sp. Root418]|uniref:hypothetical protein n=1 Tax=Massilia sp. Root418 TaxID=1736532 RepID=UPI0006F52654|nr:hypothetical protein [Massilia sp. Root418]KQW96976.1 hypothetical protein ASC94_09215 [Massilia sp. Root418]